MPHEPAPTTMITRHTFAELLPCCFTNTPCDKHKPQRVGGVAEEPRAKSQNHNSIHTSTIPPNINTPSPTNSSAAKESMLNVPTQKLARMIKLPSRTAPWPANRVARHPVAYKVPPLKLLSTQSRCPPPSTCQKPTPCSPHNRHAIGYTLHQQV